MKNTKNKTIFFTLSGAGPFKNLFFFPGSVFYKLRDALREDPSLRVIFLMPKGYREKYDEFFHDKIEKGMFFETVDIRPPKNKIQRLFYFFYSYLIYTGTTRMLATMGLRPDEPPAGGKRYLAPFKWLIANTFGKSAYFKLAIVPRLYKAVFKERTFLELFDRYKPDLVFISHIYGLFDTRLMEEASRLKIKTLGMASGWDHLDKYYLPYKVDHLIAQSAHMKEKSITYQLYKTENITVTGYPHLDFVNDASYAMSRAELLKSLGFKEGGKFLFYISGSAYCPDEPDVIEKILAWIDEGVFGPDMYLVIRPYLGGRGADRDFDKKKFEQFEEHPRVAVFKRESWFDLPQSIYFMNIMRHSDVIVSIFTSALLESAVFDRPLLSTGFDGYKKRPLHRSIRRFMLSEHFKDVKRTGGMRVANNFDELQSLISMYLKDEFKDGSERAILRESLLYKLDGGATQRIMALIDEFLGGTK